MSRTGIDNPWRDDNEPEPIANWTAAGFGADEAEVWRRWRFCIAEAHAWQAVGVDEGLHAAQWSTAGVGVDFVEAWRNAGVDATEAVAWHEFGYGVREVREFKAKGLSPADAFNGANQMMQSSGTMSFGSAVLRGGVRQSMHGVSGHPLQRFIDAGVPPQVMHSYMQRQWFDEAALEWARAGIDAADAQLWHELGLKPAEANRLERHGETPATTIRDWWSAGIPYDELAEWIGAGLTAAEAAEQRSRGITAEQAAALRALRDDDAP